MLAIDLTGRKALVTGGSRGIGAGIVRALAQAGARVAFTHTGSPRGSEAASELMADLNPEGERVLAWVAEAEDPAAMGHMAEAAAAKMGGIDIVVPNVGKNWAAPIEELDVDLWQRTLDTNLTASYVAVKVALPWMVEAGRADIVLVGSSAVFDGGGGSVAYPAGKAGLDGMMRGMMRELPRKGIRINSVHPCVVDTDLLRERYDTEEKRADLAAQVPLGRLSTTRDVGALVAFLCSDLGSFICGQSILVDGGRTLWRGR
jgi:NAD(P)-dependent dehydrogenase (short-subunit alcohol dehydrogenase family)